MIDRSVFVGMTGAKQAMQRLQVFSNNLANANTVGFRADMVKIISKPVEGTGLQTRHMTAVEKTTSDFSHGSVTQTGRNLDIAIDGDGWLAVQTKSGKEAYTRAGNLQMTPQGLLVTKDGNFVKGNSGLIAIPPAKKIEIGSDGTISIIPLGSDETSIATLDRLKLVNPSKSKMYKGADGLFYALGGGAKPDSKIKVLSGALENSNVNVVDALVGMVELSREFELQVKMMKTVAENADKATQILNLPA